MFCCDKLEFFTTSCGSTRSFSRSTGSWLHYPVTVARSGGDAFALLCGCLAGRAVGLGDHRDVRRVRWSSLTPVLTWTNAILFPRGSSAAVRRMGRSASLSIAPGRRTSPSSLSILAVTRSKPIGNRFLVQPPCRMEDQQWRKIAHLPPCRTEPWRFSRPSWIRVYLLLVACCGCLHDSASTVHGSPEGRSVADPWGRSVVADPRRAGGRRCRRVNRPLTMRAANLAGSRCPGRRG